MSLTGAQIGVDRNAVVDLVGSSPMVDQYSQNDSNNVTVAIAAAVSAFRSAAIKGGYSATDLDALTDSTCPADVRRWLLHLALDELTSGGMQRPDSIASFGTEARKWLSRVAGTAETIDGLSRATTTGGAQVRISGPTEQTFDRSNVSQRFNSRDPRL